MIYIILFPHNKKRILEGQLIDKINKCFYQTAAFNKWTIEQLIINKDYVFIVVRLDVNKSIDAIVNAFKKQSNKFFKIECSDLEEFLWGAQFWAENYLSSTSEDWIQERVKEYLITGC